jgi:hypothetical protein
MKDTIKLKDKVEAMGRERHVKGMTGTVIDISGDSIGVHFQNWGKGHNCGGKCNDRGGWYVERDNLKKISTEWND